MIRLPLSAALVLAFSAQAAFAALPILSVWPNGEAPGAKNSPVTYALVERSKDPKLPDRAVTGTSERRGAAGDAGWLLSAGGAG